jgi:hypothetical protein
LAATDKTAEQAKLFSRAYWEASKFELVAERLAAGYSASATSQPAIFSG